MDELFAAAEVEVVARADGTTLVRSPAPLGPCPASVGQVLASWAARAPERDFLAERPRGDEDGGGGDEDGGAWRRLRYGEALATVERLGQALLDRGLGPERPLLILADNGIDHALLALAAMHVGVPVAPVSPAYSLASRDHAKLRAIAAALTPGLIYVDDGAAHARALAALPAGVERVASRGAAEADTRFARLAATPAGPAVAHAHAAVGPDSVAKVLFTSGSTGQPKGVINTQRMLCANQQMIAHGWPFLARRPPLVVDWLPWSHTFGGNHNFHLVLWHGGTLYIDDGKPAPALIARTVRNLEAVAPTLYFNVPRGFDMLLPHLERDAALRARLFAGLDLLFYAAAALPPSLWQRLTALAAGARPPERGPLPFVSAWGATETAPMVTQVHFALDGPGVVGLPAPGVELKLVPTGTSAAAQGRHEVRVRGPNVTPGYWRAPALTRAAFDDEGFYCIGDALAFRDAGEPRRGLVFAGRLAEDFKLSSGTWVRVGALRVALIAACAPLVQDAVIAGHDRDAIGVLLFPDVAACRALAPELAALPLGELVGAAAVVERLRAALAAHNRAAAGSSATVAAALVLAEPPSIDADEITDKGYLNQGAILGRRAGAVARLYDDGDAGVIRV